MKKTLLIAAIAGLAFASCKKDYTCKCTVTTYTNSISVVTTASTSTGKMKKKDAETKCNESDTFIGTGTNGIKTECEIE
jgi:hypothetical protein